MEGINNYIYEIHRGTKPMALLTTEKENLGKAVEKIQKSGLAYAVQEFGEKVNVFFGKAACIEVVKSFVGKKLHELTAQEDFILGTMLGYCRIAQCERYLNKTARVS